MSGSATSPLAGMPTSTAEQLLRERGITGVAMRGLRPVGGAARLAGPARTLRYLPARNDVAAGPNGPVARAAVEALRPGDVLVVDALGSLDAAVFGDMMGARARHLGAAGVVADGAVRDAAAFPALGLPVFARGTHPAPSKVALVDWERDVAVQCGGCLVQPGDHVLADEDGVVIIPEDAVAQLAAAAARAGALEAYSQRLLEAGHPLDAAYPVAPALLDAFEDFRRDGVIPDPTEKR
ncbi:MAG TPA: hypothetical protein VFR97_00865 [Capillimicrobium sp.]|nr:hypothetical protein [Capillimicrobium sp.]